MSRKLTEAPTAEHDNPPPRWLSAPEEGSAPAAPEQRLAALIRAGETPGGLSPASRARVWARLSRANVGFNWRGLVGLRWAVAAAVLLTSGAVIGAVTAHRWWPSVVSEETPATNQARPARRAKGPRRARVENAPATEEPAAASASDETAPAPAPPVVAVEPAPAPVIPAPVAPEIAAPAAAHQAPPSMRARALALHSPAARSSAPIAVKPAPPAAPSLATPPALTPPPARTQSTLAAETQLLQQAVSLLQKRGDAAQALAALDTYDERFPRGTLRREADGTRVDALLLLGRDDEALGVLRTLTLRPQGRDQELQVIRGELMASLRCARAIPDFDAVLAQSPPPGLAERALYGRAACRLRQHDGAAAARDLQDYLRRFPAGQFAADARRALRENNL